MRTTPPIFHATELHFQHMIGSYMEKSGTWHEWLSSYSHGRHPQVIHSCRPGVGVWHRHCNRVGVHCHVADAFCKRTQTHKRGKASVSVKWLLNHRDKRVTAEEEPCCGGDRGKRLFLSVQCCRGMSAKSVFCLRRGEARLRWPCSQSDHSDFSSTVTENLFFLVVCSVGAQRFNSLAFWHILPLWVCWNGTRCLRKAREGWGGRLVHINTNKFSNERSELSFATRVRK